MKILRYILPMIFLALSAIVAEATAYDPDDVPNVQIGDSTRLVSNPDGILSPEAESSINTRLRAIRSESTAEVAVVIIDDMTDGYDIDSYANELFDLWRPGKADRDNGVLIVVVKNARKFVIRPGKGVEGVLTDAECGRILRDIMRPAFVAGDFDRGVTDAVERIQQVITDPAAVSEMKSAATSYDDEVNWLDILLFYLTISAVVTLCLVLIAVGFYIPVRKQYCYEKYLKMRPIKTASGWLSVLCAGLPLIVYIPLRIMMDRWRNGEHKCPNCGTPMRKLSEEEDNARLTPAQDTEERLKSVDYDVWLCPDCGKEVIYAFRNPTTSYSTCPQCHAQACTKIGERVVVKPTTRTAGRGERIYRCLNCNTVTHVPYTIAKLADSAPVVIFPGGRGGGFGGGGFGGGGFGGGSHGGGGASGGW